MLVATVIGTLVATSKHERLMGSAIQIIRPVDLDESGKKAEPMVAVDAIGAGVGERVIVATGSAARRAMDDLKAPVDATIVGIVDQIDIEESL